MTTRREFMQQIPAAGAGFAVASSVIFDETQARAQAPAPLKGHFHPQGKASSKYTIEVLKQAKATLPFSDTQRAQEPKKKGFNWEAEQPHDFVPVRAQYRAAARRGLRVEFRDVTVVDDEDLGKTILEIEIRGKRGVGMRRFLPAG